MPGMMFLGGKDERSNMKGKIDKSGILYIERKGKYKKQFCPYQQTDLNGDDTACGGWCPMFGEPKKYDSYRKSGTKLHICSSILLFDELIQE